MFLKSSGQGQQAAQDAEVRSGEASVRVSMHHEGCRAIQAGLVN